MFEGFTEDRIDVGESTSLFVRHGGEGRPVLLLHGHPRTSATWHRVAPRLVDNGFSVICPDLRGYGRSLGPDPAPDHSAHSKRAMAGDMSVLMRHLGHERFAVVGHDRGSYVALRLALDHPDLVSRLALLDCVPISEHLGRITAEFANRWYKGNAESMGSDNHAEWRAAMRDPAVVRAMLEDYRAGLTIDREHEEADRTAGTKIVCPLLVLWSLRDDLEDLYGDPLTIWRDWATDVRGHGIDSGHHVAEEAPADLAQALVEFFAAK
ncbi:MAG: alpha/beta hydrolase [Actinomycetota bacterium]|nr:alpha/beta hydrolase [Actinomycetota bacterium]